jgi:ACR3 family arsenite efflux pump ArsB
LVGSALVAVCKRPCLIEGGSNLPFNKMIEVAIDLLVACQQRFHGTAQIRVGGVFVEVPALLFPVEIRQLIEQIFQLRTDIHRASSPVS